MGLFLSPGRRKSEGAGPTRAAAASLSGCARASGPGLPGFRAPAAPGSLLRVGRSIPGPRVSRAAGRLGPGPQHGSPRGRAGLAGGPARGAKAKGQRPSLPCDPAQQTPARRDRPGPRDPPPATRGAAPSLAPARPRGRRRPASLRRASARAPPGRAPPPRPPACLPPAAPGRPLPAAPGGRPAGF